MSARRKLQAALLPVLLAVGWLPALAGEAPPAAPEHKFRFLALADPHFRDRTKYPQGLDGFKVFLEQSKALGADFVVILGDVCGEDPPALAQSRKIADESGAKVYFIRGNHDNAAAFKEAFGEASYSFDHKGWHFVNFDSISGSGAWLKADLEKLPAGTPLVYMQHYLPDGGGRALLEKYRAAISLTGDVHGHRHGMNGKLRDVNLPPFGGGFAVLDVMADGRIAMNWRSRGINKSLAIVHPAEGAEVAAGPGTILVNACDSHRDVLRVEYDDGSGWKPMARATDCAWTAQAELRGGKIQIRATDSANEVWTAASNYRTGAAAPAVKLGADWPVWGGTPDNRRCSTDKVAPPLRLAWATPVGGRLNPPVATGGRVYVTTASQDFEENSAVVCLDAASGKELWRAKFNCSLSCAPAVAGGVVGVFDQFGNVLAFDAQTGGKPLWQAGGVSGAYEGSGCGESGMITAADGVFYAGNSHPFDAKTGTRPWKSPGGGAMAPTAVAGGRVLTTGYNVVLGLDAKSGAVQWKYDKGTYHGCMLLPEGAVVSSSPLLGLADGKEARGTGLSRDGIDCAASPDGKFLVGNSGPWLVAANLADGKPLWRFDAEKIGFAGPLTVAGEHVWFGGRDGTLHAHSLRDGKPAWRFRLGLAMSAPAASGNAIFISSGGCVYALTGG
jgi:outer membrane protein assembly factor BamB/calcineurin-like phosphoesterase family protein